MAEFTPGGVLALDLASTVGWAYGAIEARAPLCGCWLLPPALSEGGRYATFENELAGAIALMQPSEIVLEASLTLQAMATGSSMKVARQQLTLRGIAHSEAYRASLPVPREVASYDVRLAMIGTGRFPKGEAKAAVMASCLKRGWNPPDHNAGDACLTWGWRILKLRVAKVPSRGYFESALR